MSRSIDRAIATFAFALATVTNAAAATTDASVTCNIPQPCALYKNASGMGLSATSAKSEGLFGSTTFAATSTSNRTYGVEGVDASTNNNAYNAGVYASSPHGYGLYASGPAGTAVYATSTSGVGVRATSGSSFALDATSSSNSAVLATTAATSDSVHAGVMGVDSSTNNGVNDGVLGTTKSGGYGVEGTSSDNAYGGVHGSATTGIGVNGTSSSNDGVYGSGTTGVFGHGSSTNSIGVAASSNAGATFSGTSETGDGINVSTGGSVGIEATSASYGAEITGNYAGLLAISATYPLILRSGPDSGSDVFYVDAKGNVFRTGSENTFVRTRSGASTIAFTPRTTTSSVEDTGTARLTAGAATVRFEPSFAASMDARATYQVFLTPGGDTRGLYVANKTPAGFEVRETQGGRGTLSFDYRIVASTSGHANDHMAFVSPSTFEPRTPPHAPLAKPSAPVAATKRSRR